MRKYYDVIYVDAKREFFERKNNELKELNLDIDLILFGDSITEGFDLNRYYPTSKTYLNQAIGGDVTDVMVKRFEEDCLEYNPNRIIFMGGINDIVRWHLKEEYLNLSKEEMVNQIINNITQIVKMSKDNNVDIVVCQITKMNQFENNMPKLHVIIDELNQKIVQLCNLYNVDCIDYNVDLVDDTGLLKLNYADDGLHPNHYGYEKMIKHLIKYLD